MPARKRTAARLAAQEHDSDKVPKGTAGSEERLGWTLGEECDRSNGGCHKRQCSVAALHSQEVCAERANDPDPAARGDAPNALGCGVRPDWVRQAADCEKELRLEVLK